MAGAARTRLDALAARRVFRRPLERVQELERRLDEIQLRATRASGAAIRDARQQLRGYAGRLESLSPLKVLARGYSVTQRPRDLTVVRNASDLQIGEELLTRYAAGRTWSRVEAIEADDAPQASSRREEL